MAHAMVLVKDAGGVEHLHAKQEEGAVRASMAVLKGPFSGLALIEHPQAMSYAVQSRSTCLPGDPNCNLYGLLPIGPIPITAYLPPEEVVAFVLLRVRYGSVRAFGQVLVDLHERGLEGEVQLAAAYLFGGNDHNVALELTAKDQESALQAIMEVTDHEAVRHRDVLHVDVPTARGLGSRRSA